MDALWLVFLIPLGFFLIWLLSIYIGSFFHHPAHKKDHFKASDLLKDSNLFSLQEATPTAFIPENILDFSITKEWLQEISRRTNMENRWTGFKTDHEKYPTYHLTSFSFDKNTRKCTMEIKERTEYKTVLRYQQINYNRYAIYSNEWKVREKTIRKSIKLTNEVLENLTLHEDELVSDFAYLIILHIGDPELYPSWFLRKIYDLMLESKLKITEEAERSLRFFITQKREAIQSLKSRVARRMQELDQQIALLNDREVKLRGKKDKTNSIKRKGRLENELN